MKRTIATIAAMAVAGGALAAPVTYNIDGAHTYPAFEADHMGGLSLWRGKFKKTSGKVILDVAAKSGEVDVTIDAASLDFGHDGMTNHAKGADMFDVAKYPTITYKGKVSKWNGDKPAEIDGQLTMKGKTAPVKLTVNSFLCKPHPMQRREVCGADASGTFMRDAFGIDYGKSGGFKMDTKVLISIEALKAD
jgi:polyisoprenoid-binding protein YceI